VSDAKGLAPWPEPVARHDHPACITPIEAWPDTDSTSITFTAGYTVVPDPIRAAILLRVAHMYEHRESVVIGESVAGLPLGEDDLLRNFRLWSF
jgi:hypothetical protein